MSMIALKVRNAAELLWESLDAHERRMLLLGTLWLLATAYGLATAKAQRVSLVNEVADEVERRGR